MGTVHNLVGLRKNGQEFPVDVGLNPISLEGQTNIVCSVIDASSKTDHLRNLLMERRKLEEENTRLEHLADHDALTGLYNRRAFERILLGNLSAARRSGEVVSILFADIDHFKEFNDTFGHPNGDLLLKQVGETLARSVRKEDTVARFGGEEFVISLPGIGHDQSAAFGERLRRVIQQQEWDMRPVTISLGAATFRFTSRQTALKRTMKQMIAAADQAMYHSKKAGRNRFSHIADLSESRQEE
jgi:diguanylate cyclase (GGDEF)-like protein